jgi:hypothetical protein
MNNAGDKTPFLRAVQVNPLVSCNSGFPFQKYHDYLLRIPDANGLERSEEMTGDPALRHVKFMRTSKICYLYYEVQ